MLLLFGMSMLKHQGNIRLENAIGEEARVTLSIPRCRTGVGKAMVSVQGRLKEYHAVTDGEALSRNTAVTVLELSGSQLVVGASPR
ncbi:MAG: NfeD family protein [Proteobacteria bacterium]|nr:NfeD family protein [Pseudomonadota bacterium]